MYDHHFGFIDYKVKGTKGDFLMEQCPYQVP
jgi:hypothetical protein